MPSTRRPATKRPRHPMPARVRSALLARGLLDAYRERPPYQRNDYLGWIARAKRETTRAARLEQMLAELAGGERYMRMAWRPRAGARRPPREARDGGASRTLG